MKHWVEWRYRMHLRAKPTDDRKGNKGEGKPEIDQSGGSCATPPGGLVHMWWIPEREGGWKNICRNDG